MAQIKILRPNQVCEKLNISIPTLYRWSKRGDFPQKIKFGPRSVGFRESDIDDYVNRLAEVESK